MAYRKDPKTIRRYFSDKNASERHIVIGHSQIRDCWESKQNDDSNFTMDFICKLDGKAQEMIEIIKQVVTDSKVPLTLLGKTQYYRFLMKRCTKCLMTSLYF